MNVVVVTFKLDRDSTHNPRQKKSGFCRLRDQAFCTDQTGEHHSVAFPFEGDIDEARKLVLETFNDAHITRMEFMPLQTMSHYVVE